MAAQSLAELKRTKGALIAKMQAFVTKEDDLAEGETLAPEDVEGFEAVKAELSALNERIGRVEDVLAAQADAAAGVGDGTGDGGEGDEGDEGTAVTEDPVTTGFRGSVRRTLGRGLRNSGEPASPKVGKGIFVAACARMMAQAGRPIHMLEVAKSQYGERHPITQALAKRALSASIGPNGGFVVPPDYVREIIEILRAKAVVRAAGPRTLSMPSGTLTLPKQTQAATASYVGETTPIAVSQEAVGQVVASYKTLGAMVPVSNDLLRYADPSIDAFVRDDLVQVFKRAEDLAFLRGDGTQGTPKGFASFCLSTGLITSNPAYSYLTVAQELGGAINKLESSNVTMDEPAWFMNPRAKNYLLNVQNTVGAFIFRDEMNDHGTILGVPFFTTTQIPANLAFTSGGTGYIDGSEIYLVEMTQALLLDAMMLELAASTEASYVDANGQTQNAFQQRQTLIRAVSQHDFQMRHDEAVVKIQNVRWAPAIS